MWLHWIRKYQTKWHLRKIIIFLNALQGKIFGKNMGLNLVSLNVRPDPSNKATFHQWSYPKMKNEENTNLNNHAYIIRTAVDMVGCLCPKASWSFDQARLWTLTWWFLVPNWLHTLTKNHLVSGEEAKWSQLWKRFSIISLQFKHF